MRLTSKTYEIIFITVTVVYVYTLNYGFFYGITPFRHFNEDTKSDNEIYTIYG